MKSLAEAIAAVIFAVVCLALMAVLVVILHRKNIVRLWTGTESKISFKSKKS